jgi:hypothetical protein
LILLNLFVLLLGKVFFFRWIKFELENLWFCYYCFELRPIDLGTEGPKRSDLDYRSTPTLTPSPSPFLSFRSFSFSMLTPQPCNLDNWEATLSVYVGGGTGAEGFAFWYPRLHF